MTRKEKIDIWFWMIALLLLFTATISVAIGRIDNLEQSIIRLETKIHDMAIHGMVVEDE